MQGQDPEGGQLGQVDHPRVGHSGLREVQLGESTEPAEMGESHVSDVGPSKIQ